MSHYRRKSSLALGFAMAFTALTALPGRCRGEASQPPPGAQRIRIDWSPLEDYYDISDATIFEGKERDSLGIFRRVRRLNFIAQAKVSIAYPPNFVAKLCDSDGIELQVVPVTFHPREFHWKKGERRRGKLYLPLDDEEVRLIKFVDMVDY